MGKDRKIITTTLDKDLFIRLKVLAAKLDMPYNLLIDAGIKLLLEQYEQKPQR